MSRKPVLILIFMLFSMNLMMLGFNLKGARSGTGYSIDVYGGSANEGYGSFPNPFPAPYGGQGPSNPMDLVIPQSPVIFYANVTYDGAPSPQENVSFAVDGPYEHIGYNYVPKPSWIPLMNETRMTDINGVANVTFTMPWSSENPDSLLGIWNVTVKITIEGTSYYDALLFYYDYMLHVWRVTTDKFAYDIGDTVATTIVYGTHLMQNYPAFFNVEIRDAFNVSIAMATSSLSAGGAMFCTYKNVSFNCYLFVRFPTDYSIGYAYLYVNCYDKNPATGGFAWCPQYEPLPELIIGWVIVPNDFPTIQGAINATSAGDTIYVKAGVYVENVIVNKSLTVLGESKPTTIVDGNGTGNVIYVSANNVTISGFTVRGSGTAPLQSGIRFNECNFGKVVNNNCEDCYSGIRLMTCNYGLIQNNHINGGGGNRYGIVGYDANYCTAENNTVVGTVNAVRWDESSSVQIKKNVLRDSNSAIFWASGVYYAEVEGNALINCSYGINCAGYYYCVIYHNSFIDNSVDFYDHFGPATNFTWDDGYPSGGNFWSDYVGPDLCRGPLQDETGSDGIGDSSYIIDENNEDHYPLLEPWQLHDTAVLSVTTSKDGCSPMPVVCQNFTARVNVTTTNRGASQRTFNVTAYANATVIGRAEVSLDAGVSSTITFVWDTSSFAKGNYTLKAVADTVAGDDTPADNNLTGGVVQVVMIGDVAPIDGYVGIDDIYAVASHFGLEIGSPDYNPNLDITDDGYIGIDDIFIAASHFGQEENP